MEKFWNLAVKAADQRTDLYVLDAIASRRSWFGDEVTPQAFKRDLDRAQGTLYVWLDSPGGDAFAGSAIYDMLREYSASGRGKVVAMVSLAASAASIIAMAADEIRVSVLGTIMIHRPWSRPQGNSAVLRAVADALDTVCEAQVAAYVKRTGQSREKIDALLVGADGNGTYMNARQAIELGFADGLMHEDGADEGAKPSAWMQSLTEMRIASCLEQDEARMKAIAEGSATVPLEDCVISARHVMADSIRADALAGALDEGNFNPAKAFAAGLDGAKVASLLRQITSCAGDGRGDLMDAIVYGVRAGLEYLDRIRAQEGAPDPDDAENGMEALQAALDATEDIDDSEEPESEVE